MAVTDTFRADPTGTDEFRSRHERVIRQAPAFKQRFRCGDVEIADRVGVTRCTVTKFLDDYPTFRPTRQRSAKVRLLERLEQLFASAELINEPVFEPPLIDPPDDDYAFAHNHALRLRQLRNHFDALDGLLRVGELCSQAWNGPPAYRAGMCARTLLSIGGFVSRPEAVGTSSALLRHTSEQRVGRLVESADGSAALALEEDSRRHAAHRAWGYGGFSLAWCGLHLHDHDLVGRGIGLLHRAVACEHVRADGHWPNLLRLCDELLARGHALARALAAGSAALASTLWDDKVCGALAHMDHPSLMAHWRQAAPDLLLRLAAEGRCR